MSPSLAGARRRAGLVRRALRGLEGPQPHPDVVRLTPEDHHYLTSLYDDRVPLPSAASFLRADNPKLNELRRRYESLDLPVTNASRWSEEAVRSFLDMRYFRGETLITWHYRELPRITALKFYVFLRYVAERDATGLLDTLEEDGAFGCWTHAYPGHGRVSRDLLESINELEYLERQLELRSRPSVRILDIGAGYGRLAHRMLAAYPNVEDYCCVDAVPESTFLSDFYLDYRECRPRGRVVPLDRVETSLQPDHFDLAVNIHSFPECTLEAIAWWIEQIVRLRIPRLMIVPNEPTELLSLERDGTRRDFMPLLRDAGYELMNREPVIDEPAIRDLLQIEDQFHLFTRRDL